MRPSFILSIASVLLTACSSNQTPDMTHEQSKRIEKISANMTTRCVGRYLIDLPDSFVFAWNPEVGVEGVDFSVSPMTRSQFETQLRQRDEQLQREHMDGQPNRPSLQPLNGATGALTGTIFNRAKATGSAEFARTLELVGWKDGYLIQASIDAIDGSRLELDQEVIGTKWEDIERKTIEKYKSKNSIPQKLAHLLKIYERVRGLPEGEIPTGPGLCIPNGFVAGPAVEEEALTITYRLKDSPDVYFTFQEQGDLHEDDSLLERTSQIEREMKPSGTQTVRKGARNIAEQPYEEWLMKGPTSDEVDGTMFMLHGNEVAEGADKPFVTLELFNGFRVMQPPDISEEKKERLGLYKALPHATLTEAEAVALWDKVSATLRPRQGAF